MTRKTKKQLKHLRYDKVDIFWRCEVPHNGLSDVGGLVCSDYIIPRTALIRSHGLDAALIHPSSHVAFQDYLYLALCSCQRHCPQAKPARATSEITPAQISHTFPPWVVCDARASFPAVKHFPY